ncbi:MAG: SEL1-like repeat protein [Alistipes sp.]|nr:SEL1-like repeat protein [Alistipes sp.]
MKHIFLRSALLIALFVCSTLTVQSQTLYEKELARGAGYRERAEQEAQQGNVVAMYDIAYNCRWGQAGYAKDFKRAMELCLKASEFGYPFAQDLIGNMYDTGSGVERSKEKAYEWYSKAFENLKRYADQGNVMAMDMLGNYYDGYKDSRFEDDIKALYWHLRALECGAVVAYGIGADYASGYGAVEKDENFALAWYARFCLDYEKNYKIRNDEVAKLLSNAGYIRSEWEALAEPTYISVPRVASDDEEQIKEVMLLTLDILEVKAEEFRTQQKRLAANRPGAGVATNAAVQSKPAPATTNYASSSSSSHTTTYATQQPAPRKRKWLSALGKVVQAATGIATGNMAMATTAVTGGANNRMAELNQLFSYSGTVRRGQTDYSGRVISDEITAPAPMGQAHYVFYEDGYCHATTVVTCVHCYGKSTCYLCNGQGTYYHAYFKSNQPCPICGGRGVCQNCQGLGYQVTTKLWAPGEAEGYLHVQREMKSSSSSSSHSHSHSSSSSSVCPDCGGKGYRPEAYQYAAQSSFAPYHNSGGNECPICGTHTDHYHYRCTTCKQH